MNYLPLLNCGGFNVKINFTVSKMFSLDLLEALIIVSELDESKNSKQLRIKLEPGRLLAGISKTMKETRSLATKSSSSLTANIIL